MENEALMSNNIMFDRRVVRGNTYAAQVRHATRAPRARPREIATMFVTGLRLSRPSRRL
jgi:hypothetical protein